MTGKAIRCDGANKDLMHDPQLVMQVCLPSAEAPHRLVVSVYLPETYPSSSPPVVELHGSAISADQQAQAIQHLDEIFQPGEVSQVACAGCSALSWSRPAPCGPF